MRPGGSRNGSEWVITGTGLGSGGLVEVVSRN